MKAKLSMRRFCRGQGTLDEVQSQRRGFVASPRPEYALPAADSVWPASMETSGEDEMITRASRPANGGVRRDTKVYGSLPGFIPAGWSRVSGAERR